MLYFRNSAMISSFFIKIMNTPVPLRSSVVYQYMCDCCEQSYIGSTKLQMFYRCSQHCSVSHRTGRHITKSMSSSIRLHSQNHDHPFKLSNFTILDSCNSTDELRILESLYINKLKPTLNDYQLAGKLHIAM